MVNRIRRLFRNQARRKGKEMSMDSQGMSARVLAALHDAALDDVQWPATAALIDQAVGIKGNTLLVGEGPKDDVRVVFAGKYCRGQRNPELEHDYLANYHFRDERVPRVRQLPDGKLVHVTTLYSAEEIKTSPTYNEFCLRTEAQNGLIVRLDLAPRMHLTWSIHDPVKGGAWQSGQLDVIERLLPDVRKFMQVRQALASAQALNSSLSGLLDNTRLGVIQLDRSGRILEANDYALEILRRDDGLHDENGTLRAWFPADNTRLQKLLAGALPPLGGLAAADSMPIRRLGDTRKLMLCINPVESPALDFGARRVAALVLLTEPRGRPRVDAKLVADLLGLTAAESQVAVMLSEGMTASDIAMATGRQASTVNTLIQRAYRKLGITRQTELMRLVLSLSDAPTFRP